MKLSDYLNSINYSKKNIIKDDIDEKNYVPYVVNRCLSYFPDTIMYANRMNQSTMLDNKLQYDYYLHSLRARKRFSKWAKKEEISDLDVIKEYFSYSNQKAKDALNILNDEDISSIKKEMFRGG